MEGVGVVGSPKFDLIVCSDCVYSVASVAPLLSALRQLSHSNTLFLLSNEQRSAWEQVLHGMCCVVRCESCGVISMHQ